MQNLSTGTILASVKLTPAEKTIISKVDKTLSELTSLHHQFRDPSEGVSEGRPSGLYDRICSTAETFTQSPTIENFRAHLEVIAEVDLIAKHRAGIEDLGLRATTRAKGPLGLVARGILDRAEQTLAKEHEARREAAKNAGFEGHLSALVSAIASDLNHERRVAVSDPSSWLHSNGYLD